MIAPSLTLSTVRVIDVDEDEECDVDPVVEWLEQQATLLNPTSVLWRLRKLSCGWRRAGTRLVDFTAERFEEQRFDRCDAVPQFFANYELEVSIEVHMDDLHGTGPRLALDVTQTNFSQKFPFKIQTVYEVG